MRDTHGEMLMQFEEDDAVRQIGITEIDEAARLSNERYEAAQEKLKQPQEFLAGIPETRATFTPDLAISIKKEQSFLNNATSSEA